MKRIDWKNLTSIVGFIGALAGGYYKLQSDAQLQISQQLVIKRAEKARYQIDSLRTARRLKELKWELQDSIRLEIAKLEQRLR
tara:strand:- start:1863 stop:2111 length:249 start_codon:yes stop_codon:yes gene_type:complete